MVRKNILCVLCLLMALTINAKPKKVQVPAVSVGELRTERMVNPMSLDTASPRLGWQIKSTQSDVKQTAYRLIVASSLAKATKLSVLATKSVSQLTSTMTPVHPQGVTY